MSALKDVCDLIQSEMGLADDQVFLWDQKIDVPADNRLYIAVGVASARPYANRRGYDPSGAGLDEQQSINVRALIDITVYGKTPDARDRKEEVLLALNSTQAQQLSQANAFRVGVLPVSFVNLSELDGPAIPYRFVISVALHYQVSKTKAVDYYDSFTTPTVITDP